MLTKWKQPETYIGQNWESYYVFLNQRRDSDALERSNFRSALANIGGESDTVLVVRERHRTYGWIEWIAIHEDDMGAREAAIEILEYLSEYPVVNGEDYAEEEYGQILENWCNLTIRQRVACCREAGVSIFAARRDYLPADDGTLYSMLID